MKRYAFDIETNGLLDDLDTVHSLVIQDIDTGEVFSLHNQHDTGSAPNVADGLHKLMEADEIIGHNIIKFDIPALQKVYPWFDPKGAVIDTLVISRLIWTNIADYDQKQTRKGRFPGKLVGSHSLEAWGLRLGEWKGDYAKVMAERGLDPWAEWNQEMQDYCVQDVVITVKFYQRILSRSYAQTAIRLEHDFAHKIGRAHV